MVLLLVFMQLTRDLFAIAKFLLKYHVGLAVVVVVETYQRHWLFVHKRQSMDDIVDNMGVDGRSRDGRRPAGPDSHNKLFVRVLYGLDPHNNVTTE